MIFDDDFVRLYFDGGAKTTTCRSIGVDWPPPEELNIMGFIMVRRNYSGITDEQRAAMTCVCRGAEYFPKQKEDL